MQYGKREVAELCWGVLLLLLLEYCLALILSLIA